jgi:amino acid transporter
MKALFLFMKKALFPFFILVKISLQYILLSFIIDSRKLKVCTPSQLHCPIVTFIFLIMLLLFCIIFKIFHFSNFFPHKK